MPCWVLLFPGLISLCPLSDLCQWSIVEVSLVSATLPFLDTCRPISVFWSSRAVRNVSLSSLRYVPTLFATKEVKLDTWQSNDQQWSVSSASPLYWIHSVWDQGALPAHLAKSLIFWEIWRQRIHCFMKIYSFKFLCLWILVLTSFHKFSSLLSEDDNTSDMSSVALPPSCYILFFSFPRTLTSTIFISFFFFFF